MQQLKDIPHQAVTEVILEIGSPYSAPTPLEQGLAHELTRMQILGPGQDALAASKAIIQWMTEEYDRQLDRARFTL